jgi:hypothetical protein
MNTPVVPDNQIKMWCDPRFQMLAAVDKLLDGSKTWGGMEYTYHPIDPVKYRPVAEQVRKALDDLQKEYGVEE